jgi:hypothetical protein
MDTEQLTEYLLMHGWKRGQVKESLAALALASDLYRQGFTALEAPDVRPMISAYLNRITLTLCPPHCKGLTESFWRSPTGLLLLDVQSWLVADDLFTAKSTEELRRSLRAEISQREIKQ